ncbi:MAG: ECF transporter S component [Lachnospiraceae bacterium]|nr:ECF transporter S component [Lachnospiraceae bacterium]
MNKHTLFITQTAVMIALLVGAQFVTRPLGQFVTGSLVNLILLISLFIIGTGSGITVGLLSPFMALLAGIGPAFPQIVPFMATGNIILVLVASLVKKHMAKSNKKDILIASAGLIAASAAKFLFLWIALVVVALPLIPGIKEQQIAVISVAFTWPQLVTALIGSTLAMIIVPLLKRARIKS